jgi:protein TonB
MAKKNVPNNSSKYWNVVMSAKIGRNYGAKREKFYSTKEKIIPLTNIYQGNNLYRDLSSDMKNHIYLEAKKTAWADLDAHRPLLLSIGLFLSLAIVNLSFMAKQRLEKEVIDLQIGITSTDELLDIPLTEQAPPPPSVQQPRIIEVPDEAEIIKEMDVTFDVEVNTETKIQEITINTEVTAVLEDEKADEIFVVVEESAQPTNGMSNFYKFTSSNIRYPAQARRMGVEGRVFVEFVVGKNGSLQDITVIKGIGAGCDEEAIRVLKLSPPWQPAKQRGRAVKQRIVLPIIFKMHQTQEE